MSSSDVRKFTMHMRSQISAVHYRIRQKRATAGFDLAQQSLVQPVDHCLRLRRCRQRSKHGGDIAEGADAEIACDRFEFGMRVEEPEGVFRQRHVVRNRLLKSRPPGLLKRHPDLQRPEAARILRPEIEVIDRVRIEIVIGRVGRKTYSTAASDP